MKLDPVIRREYVLFIAVFVLLMTGIMACDKENSPDGSMSDEQPNLVPLPEEYQNKENPLPSSSSIRTRGKKIYMMHCSSCHGEKGKGDGTVARGLTPPPRDFTKKGFLQNRSDKYLYYRIREGVKGTAMPGWKHTLRSKEIWSVIHYLRTFHQK